MAHLLFFMGFDRSVVLLGSAMAGMISVALTAGAPLLATMCFVLGYIAALLPFELESESSPGAGSDLSPPTAAAAVDDSTQPKCFSSAQRGAESSDEEKAASSDAAESVSTSVKEEGHDSLDVVQLILAHSDSLNELHALVRTHPHFKPELHDGLWLLRYLLSHKRVPAAAAAARSALRIRHELQLDDVAVFVRTHDMTSWPHFHEILPLGGIFQLPARPANESGAEDAAWRHFLLESDRGATPTEALAAAQVAFAAAGGDDWQWFDRGLIEIGQLKDVKMHELLPLRHKLNMLSMYAQEWAFQMLDEATRRRGKIVKLTRVMSVKGFRLRMLNLKLVLWDAENKARTQDLYPQLLGQMYYTNPPKSLLWAWINVIRPLMPQRVTSKTNVLDTDTRAAHRQLLERHCKRESLPAFVGGTSRLPWPPLTFYRLPPIGLTRFQRYDIPPAGRLVQAKRA